MRTLLAFLFAFILMVTMLQADAVLEEENEQGTKAKRHHLSEASALGRKGNIPDSAASASAITNTAGRSGYNNKNDDKANGDGDDDTNGSYDQYGNGTPSTSSHHYFVDRRPPIHGRV